MFIVDAVLKERESWQQALLEQIDHSIREAVRESLDNAVLAASAPAENTQSEPSRDENDAAMFDFLDSFQV